MKMNYLSVLLLALVTACSSEGGQDGTSECGDGLVDGTEQCDDGNVTAGDGCSATCQSEAATCGDGMVSGTEGCDDGNTSAGDGCSATCQPETSGQCGNGSLDGTEACDDGNTVAGDGCSAACTVESAFVCGGEPSDCALPAGTCAAPFQLTLANTGGTLVGTGTGDTTASTNQVADAPCDAATAGAGKDHIWQFTLTEPRDVTITINSTTVFDSALRLTRSACKLSTEVDEFRGVDGCSDAGVALEQELLAYSALAAGTYYVVIDGYDAAAAGAYSFTVSAAPTLCGNGQLDPLENCDDGNIRAHDGCSASCDEEATYNCTGTPSHCTSTCGNGTLDAGEECEDGNTLPGDRCSATCKLESDTKEVEPNNLGAQATPLTASNHIIRGALTAGDVDLYQFTLTAPAIVQLETYNEMNNIADYSGVGTLLPKIDCTGTLDTEVRVFDSTGSPATNGTAVLSDDDDGDQKCSYIGPHDSADNGGANPNQGLLPAGTYIIKVNHFDPTVAASRYILDLNISSVTPVAPVAGDLALNEVMAADNLTDTNCDGVTTGTADEFIELVNVSSKVLDMTGVTISDSVALRHTFAPGTTGTMSLDPGKAIVVWSGGAPACAGVTNFFVASSGQLALNDGGDTIHVDSAAAVPLITRTYPAATTNKSSNRSPDVTGTSFGLHSTVNGALGDFSPGKHANGTPF